VTALMACSGLLWVGTNVGIALTIPLPRLEGVPIIKVGITISYHSHFGPIKFFLPLITSKAMATSTLKTTASFKKSVKISCDSPNKSSREKLSVSRQESLVEQSIQELLPTPTSETSLQPTVTPSKRRALDILNSPLLNDRKSVRNFFSHLSANSSKTLPSGFSRKSSTLSASMRSTGSSSLNSEHGTCDVYGLYRDLIYVKEDYNEETRTGNLLNSSFECLRKSDPELSSITAKISTLDRRLKMKTSRPRSLDLSNWSVGSHSSSSHSYLYSSSGSDDNMSLRLLNNNNNIHNNNNHSKSVSRSNSNASQKINDTELMDISETVVATTTTTPSSNRRTPPILLQRQSTINDYDISSVSGTYTKLKKNKKPASGFEDAHNAANNRKTIITLMGGRGYINWRHIWYSSSTDFQASPNTSPSISATGTTKHQRNSSMSTFNNLPNSNDAHILIWEKKL
jgi:Rho guanine nucleotide exchange factor 10